MSSTLLLIVIALLAGLTGWGGLIWGDVLALLHK